MSVYVYMDPGMFPNGYALHYKRGRTAGTRNNPQVEEILASDPEIAAIGITNIHDGLFTMIQPNGEPVTEEGQSVAELKNLGSFGGWFTAPSLAACPVYRGAGGLEFNNPATLLLGTENTLATTTSNFTVVSWTGEQSAAASSGANAIHSQLMGAGGAQQLALIYDSSGGWSFIGLTNFDTDTGAAASPARQIIIRDGATTSGVITTATNEWTDSADSLERSYQGMSIGSQRDTIRYADGVIKAVVGWSRALTSEVDSLPLMIGE